MKETTPKLTQKKKKEAQKWIDYIYQNTGIKFSCKKIKDYVFIKMLYLLLVDYNEMENEFLLNIMKTYVSQKNIKKVQEANYFGYSLKDVLKQYIVKYYYGDLTNFAVIWEYYQDLVEGREEPKLFEKRIDQGYKVLVKKLEKEAVKTNHLYDNLAVDIIEENTIQTFISLQEELEEDDIPHKIEMVWRTLGDEKVCKECADLSGRRFLHVMDLPQRHPNCRCYYEIYIDGELFTNDKLFDII